MADGGFLVKIEGQKEFGCYAIAFDYDEWKYKVNDGEVRDIPEGAETISIEIE
jgi:hypothetical protein